LRKFVALASVLLLVASLAYVSVAAQLVHQRLLAEVYCGESLVAIARIEARGGEVEVSAYPPVATCGARLVSVPRLVYAIVESVEPQRTDGMLVYRVYVPPLDTLVEIRAHPETETPVLAVFGVMALAAVLGAAISWANRHTVEVL